MFIYVSSILLFLFVSSFFFLFLEISLNPG